ncbi:hypothetical protein WN55_09247 [Dufourea novaeangliae]|uniref:Uncharacterized protein n=1 Tax=Dufourea novaeangliae TaxID=178035 RepID=A0A154P922_DUFNO|nr:hypothetical protein WN55_09247 [Dufourea novaeangliae]
MSARSQRGVREASPGRKLTTPRYSGRNRASKPPITYDYDAAVSQPDVPNFLELKKNGRYPTVSGHPCKKRATKTRIRSRLMSRKNFQKRYQARATKRGQNNARSSRSSEKKHANRATESVASGTSDDEKDEKENVTGNNAVDVENLTNLLKKTVDGQNVSYKITTIEVIEKGKNDNQTAENTEECEKSKENEKPEECDNAAKSPVLQSSRIPRAKIVAFPVHTVQEFHLGRRMTASSKTKDSENSKCPPTCDQDNVEVSEKETVKKSHQVQEQIKQELVHFKKTTKDPKIPWNDEHSSEWEADEDIEGDHVLLSTDESPAVTDGIDDPRVLSILQSLKLKLSHPCKSCTNEEPPSSNRQEDDSDLKSSSPDECKKKKWPLKHRKYVETSSEETSSEKNDGKDQKKNRSQNRVKSPLILRNKTSSVVNATPKMSGRRRSNFNFFNTLFDIVFWPYLFLKSNR